MNRIDESPERGVHTIIIPSRAEVDAEVERIKEDPGDIINNFHEYFPGGFRRPTADRLGQEWLDRWMNTPSDELQVRTMADLLGAIDRFITEANLDRELLLRYRSAFTDPDSLTSDWLYKQFFDYVTPVYINLRLLGYTLDALR